MKRKVIKLDKDGKEMKDKKGNYIFEEIEVAEPQNDPDPTPDKKTTLTDIMAAIEELKKGTSKLTFEEVKKMLEEVNKQTDPDSNPPAEPTIADLIKSVDEFGKKLGTEPGVHQLGNQPPAPEPARNSLGFNPRSGKMD